MIGWMRRHKFLTVFFVIVSASVMLWNYFYDAELDKEAYNNLIPAFMSDLESQGWFDAHKDVKCHIIYYKDEADFGVKECTQGIEVLSYPYSRAFFSLFSVDFRVLSIHQTLFLKTDVVEKLKRFLIKEQASNKKPLLLMIRRNSLHYGRANGIELILTGEK